MNKARKVAGFEPVSPACIRMKRRIVAPFAPDHPKPLEAGPVDLYPPDDLQHGKGGGGGNS